MGKGESGKILDLKSAIQYYDNFMNDELGEEEALILYMTVSSSCMRTDWLLGPLVNRESNEPATQEQIDFFYDKIGTIIFNGRYEKS